MASSVKNRLINWAQISAGICACALAYRMFLIPNEIAPGGFTGMGQLIGHLSGWPVGALAIMLNAPLFALSARSMGMGFSARSVAATVLLSLAIDFLPIEPTRIDGESRMLLAAVFGGALGGVGFGLILRGNATTGGSDMLAKLIRTRTSFLSIGAIMFAIDALVIIASAFVFDMVSALFALISAFIMNYIIDYVVDGLNPAHAYYIISQKSDQIASAIVEQNRRGVTGFSGRGIYSGAAQEVLLCVVNRTETIQLRHIIASIDPTAFVFAVKAHEVLGEGFKPHAAANK